MSTGVALQRAMAEAEGIVMWRDGDGNWVSLLSNQIIYTAESGEAQSLEKQLSAMFWKSEPVRHTRHGGIGYGPDDGDSLG